MTTDITTLDPIKQQVSDLTVNTSESLITATEYLSRANKFLDILTAEKETLTKPLNATLKEIRARYKPTEDTLTDIIATIRQKMSAYQSNLLATQRAAEAKIAAKVESGYIKTETAVSKLEDLGTIESSIVAEAGKVTFVEVPDFHVIDIAALPIEYHLANEVAIRRDMKEGIQLPGVKYFTVQQVRNKR